MVRFVLSLADVLRFRFAISPLGEAVRLARALANPKTFAQGAHAAWLQEQRPALERLREHHDLRPLLALLAARPDYYPDFLTPTPDGTTGEIDDELEQLRAAPPPQVRREIAQCLDAATNLDRNIERQLRSSTAGVLLADLLHALWEAVIAPAWPQLQDVLERDVLYRTRLLARGGLASLFTDLEPLLTLRDNDLFVDMSTEGTCALGGDGLRLTPSAFILRWRRSIRSCRRSSFARAG
jgi:hypothetical protein